MAASKIVSEAAAALAKLDEQKQAQALAYIKSLLPLKGTPGKDLLELAGAIDPAVLSTMEEAVKESRTIDYEGW